MGRKDIEHEQGQQQVSVDDFAAALDGDVHFSALKRALPSLAPSHDHALPRNKDKKKRSEPLAAPLPKRLRDAVSREVAYEQSSKDISKWGPIVRANREKDVLEFSPDTMDTVRAHNLANVQVEPKTDLEKDIYEALKTAGMTTEQDILAGEQLAMKKYTEEEAMRRQAELAKMRSLTFFQEIKDKRRAKIKSKRYRKEQKKGKRGREEEGESRADAKIKADMARARERLTLKTRKASQWAHQMLQKRYDDEDGTRVEIMHQVREKERQRREIMGEDKTTTEEEEGSDDEWERSATKRSDRKHFAEENESDSNEDVSGDQESTDDEGKASEQESVLSEAKDFEDVLLQKDTKRGKDPMQVQGRRTFGGPKRSGTKEEHHGTSTEEEEVEQAVDALSSDDEGSEDQQHPSGYTQAELFKMAFAGDMLEEEFSREKEAAVQADAPKVEDITLPGWGTWAGEGMPMTTRRFLRETPGIDPSTRTDKKYRHVIINERRLREQNPKYAIPKLPHPYQTQEQWQKQMSRPIGPEWNSVSVFRERIKPSLVKRSGLLINPIKFVKQDGEEED